MTDWTKCSTVHIAREIAEQEAKVRRLADEMDKRRCFVLRLQTILVERAELHHAVAEAEVPV